MSGHSYHAAPATLAEAPPGCPMHQQWTPLNEDYLTDPYPIANALRDEHPVWFPMGNDHHPVASLHRVPRART